MSNEDNPRGNRLGLRSARSLPSNRRVGNEPLAAPSSVLSRTEVERIVARDLMTPPAQLQGDNARAILLRDRRALIGELNQARAENAQLRALIAKRATDDA